MFKGAENVLETNAGGSVSRSTDGGGGRGAREPYANIIRERRNCVRVGDACLVPSIEWIFLYEYVIGDC